MKRNASHDVFSRNRNLQAAAPARVSRLQRPEQRNQPGAGRKINQVVDVGGLTTPDAAAMRRAMLTTIGIPLSVATSADAIRCDLLKRWRGQGERSQILRFVQPSLIGLIDGTISTLAPIFAAAFLAG